LGPRERIVPLNSWPMVMGRDSWVTGCGVMGEKLVGCQYCEKEGLLHSARGERLRGLGNGEGILRPGEVFMEVWKISSVTCSEYHLTTVILHTCSANADKSRLHPHLSLEQLLRRRGNIVLDPDIFFAVVSRGTHDRGETCRNVAKVFVICVVGRSWYRNAVEDVCEG
jgi:hypothetical protein